MIDISVIDIYGYNISNESDFIIIKTDFMHKFLKKMISSKDGAIFKIDKKSLDPILNERNIDISQFIPLGHIYYDGKNRPNRIVLANKNISLTPTSYVDIMSYGEGKIIKPIQSNSDYVSFGLLYTDNTSVDTNIAMIEKKYLINIANNKENPRLVGNDFFMLSDIALHRYVLNKNGKYKDDPHFMKLTNTETKYITKMDDDVKLKNKIYNKNQKISYNTQGELIMDDKCLTYNNNKIYFDKCNNKTDQMWDIYDNNIHPLENPEKCLSSFGDNIEMKDCADNSEASIWNVENSDSDKSSDYRLPEYKGKTMVLVDSDDPWYLNKDVTLPIIYNKKLDLTGKKYQKFASYDNKLHEGREMFNNLNNDNTNNTQSQIVYLLILIIVILCIYKYLCTKKNN